MKDKTLLNALNRGFTLIELMIVIVILGVLMGTILPRLTGAQARARDTGRIADLNTISQALETYYDDNGEYPGTNATGYCLVETDVPGSNLATYLKNGTIPRPPQAKQVTLISGQTCTGTYYYAPIRSRGIENNGFILASDVETYQNANFDAGVSGFSVTGTTNSNAIALVTDASTLVDEDNENAQDTVYLVVQ